MFCSNCGERIDPDSHFCVHCGNKVGQRKAQQSAMPDHEINRQPNQSHAQQNDMPSNADNDTQPVVHNMQNRTGNNAHSAMGMPAGAPNQDPFNKTSVYEDMIAYVSKNGHYYDRKWKAMDQNASKHSWNFAAFFLTIFWLGYRRLFKEMVVIIGVLFVLGVVNIYVGWDVIVLQFINYGIGLVVGIGLGLYGNYLYRRHVEKNVNQIRSVTHSQDEKESLLQAKGGTSIGGVVNAIVVFVIYFGIMY